jgi:predicted ArsR family transcriptional regulator
MQSTRQEILSILREERQATVEDLAQSLDLTPMTIRHHLNVLQAQNLVVASKVRRSKTVGRPRLVYTLTDAADELFPHGYGELARRLVAEIKETVGEEELRRIFRRIAIDLAGEAPPRQENQTFEDRLDQVSEFLEGQGFLARWEESDEGYVLTSVNCPYRRVSHEHGDICIMDLELLERLLGVKPRRLEGAHDKDTPCRFLLQPEEAD